MDGQKRSSKVSRRDFVKGAIAGTAAVAGGAMLPTFAGQTALAAAMPEKWDKEAEVVVVGYGGAGMAAAITAKDAGATVLVLEKQAQDAHTPNTRMCAGVFISPDNVDDAIAYMEIAARVNVDLPESKDIPEDVIKVWAEEMTKNIEWMTGLGAKGFVVYADQGRDPDWPGNAAIKAYQLRTEKGTAGVGTVLYDFLNEQVTSRGIEIMWETPGDRLVANEAGEVVGVIAKDKDGKEIAVKASKGVILTTGGFEFNDEMIKTYLAAYPMTFYGNPDNTGDGIRMAMELGADLWHMTVLGGGFKAKFPDFPTAFGISPGKGGYMFVDKFGKRFKAENELGGYSGFWNALVYDTVNYTWPRIPVYWVLDDATLKAAPLVYTFFGAAGPIGMYEWSADNSKEVEKGWIVKGDTVADLAAKLGVDAAVLEAQVKAFNDGIAAGQDEFGRPVDTMAAMETGPFYAMTLWPGLNNTYGGPRRDAQARILDVNGNPIPRLYSSGELGSLYVQYPQGGANVGECFAFGRVAAVNAVAEQPWG